MEGTFKLQTKKFLERDAHDVLNGNISDIINFLESIRDKYQTRGVTVSCELDSGCNDANLLFSSKQFVEVQDGKS